MIKIFFCEKHTIPINVSCGFEPMLMYSEVYHW